MTNECIWKHTLGDELETCGMHKHMHTSAQTQENVTACDICLFHYGCACHLSNSTL